MSARVLVVDDIFPNVKLLEAKLSSEYYEVMTATSGPDALQALSETQPDLVLLDVMMPGMDGFEVCRAIKENPETAHIPVVMVTALTDSSDRVRGLEAGADDFLSKPVNDMALMARVRSLVRLKMTVDEWRARETTANQLGVVDNQSSVMTQPVEQAKILVIEDQEFECQKIADTLARDDDDIVSVPGGMQAMEQIKADAFDLIIVSLNLANEDGLRLCSHLRSNERTRQVPLLMVAYEDDMPRIAHGLEIGAHDYILRPVDRNELLARVRTQVRRRRFQLSLRENYEISLSMALTDSLTGLYNRRYLEVHLQKLLEDRRANQKNLGLLILDIDHFKSVNDTHGHNVGDEILKIFAHRLKDNLRSLDLVARLGGEEFVVVMPDISTQKAHFIAERLRHSIADLPFPCAVEGGQLTVTTSIGGVIITHDEVQSKEDVLGRADKYLYEAKETGRNCTVFEGVGKLDPEIYQPEERKTIG